MKPIEVGVDVGFSSTKVRCDNGRRQFPSVVGRAITGTAGYSFAGNGLAIRLGSDEYYAPVGKTALRHQRQAVGRRDGSWVLGQQWLQLLCTALGQIVDGNAQARLVTGLPVNDWATYHAGLKERLDGRNLSFQLKGGDPQQVQIESVKVPSQPFGALFSVMFDAFGHSQANEYTEAMGAVVDVGGHTTNIQAIDAMVTVDDMSGSRAMGLLHPLDDATDEINAMFPRLGFTTHDTAEALADSHFYAQGKRQDIADYTNHHLEQFTASIVEYVDNTLALAGRIRWLLLTGGGVNAIGEQLRQMLLQNFGNVQIAEDPRWANVEGYLRLARRATKEGLWWKS